MSGALREQRRLNRDLGIDLQRVSAPDTTTLLAALTAEARKLAEAAQAARATNTVQPPTSPAMPAGFQSAQNGSAPIIVTAPPNISEQQAMSEQQDVSEQQDTPEQQAERQSDQQLNPVTPRSDKPTNDSTSDADSLEITTSRPDTFDNQ